MAETRSHGGKRMTRGGSRNPSVSLHLKITLNSSLCRTKEQILSVKSKVALNASLAFGVRWTCFEIHFSMQIFNHQP